MVGHHDGIATHGASTLGIGRMQYAFDHQGPGPEVPHLLQASIVQRGGRQFTVQGRLWEQDGEGTVLRVFVGSAHAESDSVFG